jgi:spore maturation protein CgeB
VNVLIVDPYYPAVLDALYVARPGLSDATYDEQWRAVMDLAFGTSDAYSHHLAGLGHTAHEVVTNCRPLQLAWARAHAPRLARLPWRLAASAIVLAQARALGADVVYAQSIGAVHPLVLRQLQRGGRLLVGQIASAVPAGDLLRRYDLILTSFPHFVDRLGVRAELFRIGFDERILSKVAGAPAHDVVFVGQLGGAAHRAGNEIVEAAARRLPVDVWGPGEEEWPPGSPFRARHHGLAWGIDMYRVLAGSRIALNRHIAASEGHANNMRLFEATGAGTMLLTDERLDLDQLFEPGRELVTYAGADDLVEKARWYLEHEGERATVAAAGQARTLASHTYAVRMRELVEILERYRAGVRRMMSSRTSSS